MNEMFEIDKNKYECIYYILIQEKNPYWLGKRKLYTRFTITNHLKKSSLTQFFFKYTTCSTLSRVICGLQDSLIQCDCPHELNILKSLHNIHRDNIIDHLLYFLFQMVITGNQIEQIEQIIKTSKQCRSDQVWYNIHEVQV